MLKRKCKECGEPIEPYRKNKRFCCNKCRNKNWVKDHPRSANFSERNEYGDSNGKKEI